MCAQRPQPRLRQVEQQHPRRADHLPSRPLLNGATDIGIMAGAAILMMDVRPGALSAGKTLIMPIGGTDTGERYRGRPVARGVS